METPTPALVIDLPTVKRNVARLAEYGRQNRLDIRPHTKTHKSILMAKLQLEAGAVGLAVAKVGEAMVMAEASDDLFVAYPALDPWRCERLAQLARTKTIRVGFDSREAAEIGPLFKDDECRFRTSAPVSAATADTINVNSARPNAGDRASGRKPNGSNFCAKRRNSPSDAAFSVRSTK